MEKVPHSVRAGRQAAVACVLLTVQCVEQLQRLQAGADDTLDGVDVQVLVRLPLGCLLPVDLIVGLWCVLGGGAG